VLQSPSPSRNLLEFSTRTEDSTVTGRRLAPSRMPGGGGGGGGGGGVGDEQYVMQLGVWLGTRVRIRLVRVRQFLGLAANRGRLKFYVVSDIRRVTHG
jgi:hypothetical protein